MKYVVDITIDINAETRLIPCIKAMRSALDLGLKEAKDLTEAAREASTKIRVTAEQYGRLVVTFNAHGCGLGIYIDNIHTTDPRPQWDFTPSISF
jgi:ribosomal protein L7/L12